MAEFSREIDAALRKLAFHFASRLPQAAPSAAGRGLSY